MPHMDETKYHLKMTLPKADFYFAETILDHLALLHHPFKEDLKNCELCHCN
jgi:hypothetical protein